MCRGRDPLARSGQGDSPCSPPTLLTGNGGHRLCAPSSETMEGDEQDRAIHDCLRTDRCLFCGARVAGPGDHGRRLQCMPLFCGRVWSGKLSSTFLFSIPAERVLELGAHPGCSPVTCPRCWSKRWWFRPADRCDWPVVGASPPRAGPRRWHQAPPCARGDDSGHRSA